MSYANQIAQQLKLRPQQVNTALQLLDEGNTVPFIARYRKEMTGSLDEDQLRQIDDYAQKLKALDERRETVLSTIEEQGKLTPELKQRVTAATTLTELEDLYQPYRPKRNTRASVARERGLQPLADHILKQPRDGKPPEQAAHDFLNDDVPSIEDALAGARDIVAETVSDDADVRAPLREKALKFAQIRSKRVKNSDDEKGVYETYYDFEYRVDRLRPYQVLAINRGEAEKVLRVSVEIAERDWRGALEGVYRPDRRSPYHDQLQLAFEDAAKRLLLPAIERDVRRTLTETAEAHAIDVFADNLHSLLLQPPLADRVVMGVDPAYRTGCKVAVVDATGRVLDTTAVYPHAPQNQRDDALKTLNTLIAKHGVSLIAIGNGTASRETEALIAELTRQKDNVHYLIVNEAGASVYSASTLARAELPDLDVTLRGAVSIARRAQDPLAELVKIDPKSIGVGLYQHDVNQKQLEQSLSDVVETVVNRVGVDVNTASPALLQHVAGVGGKQAERIVHHRDENGAFTSRAALLKVKGMGAKTFEQAAGFLRVRDGDDPLDASAIHPESYPIAEAVLQRANTDATAPLDTRETAIASLLENTPSTKLAEELDTGLPTLEDILEQLVRPGRDPRADLPAPILRSDVLSMEDLVDGMVLQGTVRNVVDFGAFIDIGVKQDGLLHVSKIPRSADLSVGDVVKVEILNVDIDRGRIGLGWVKQAK